MRRPLLSSRGQQQGSQTAQQTFLPAPLRGLSSSQPAINGNPSFATSMTNFWSNEGAIDVRPGSITFAGGGSGGPSLTIASYNAPVAANSKLYACTNSGIYDVTAGGVIGATVQALTDGLMQFVNFTNSAGTAFLIGCNGVDGVLYYNGTAWSTATITGVTAANLEYVWIFKRRLFFIEKDTSNVWFLPVDSIQGEASKFPIGPLFAKGGKLVSGFSWTLDGGVGPDDYCAFVSSEGEVAIYAGTDPTSSSSFGLVGVFYLGKPRAARCWARVGPDVLLATENGFFSLTAVVRGKEATPKTSLSNEIAGLWRRRFALALLSTRECYSVVFYSQANVVLITLPVSGLIGAASIQFVFNLTNGTWTLVTGWNANHFYEYKGALYYAENTQSDIVKCWIGATDWTPANGDGQVITAEFTQVAAALAGGRDFYATQVRPLFNQAVGADTATFCGSNIVQSSPTIPWFAPDVDTLNVAHVNFAPTLAYITDESTAQRYFGCDVQFLPVAMP